MKILIISKCPTHPTNAGNRRFILSQVELLKKMGNEVYFLFVEENGLSHKFPIFEKSILQMRDFFKDKFYVFRVGKFQKLIFNIRQRVRAVFNHGFMKCDDYYPQALSAYVKHLNSVLHFDACFINYYYLSKLFLDCDIPLQAITTHDYFAYKDLLVGIRNVVNNTTAHEEAKALQRCQHIFALNTDEASYFSKLAPKSTIYNVFSTYSVMKQPLTNVHNLLFLSGDNDYNVKGLDWFLKNIFPSIIESFPDIKLLIAGSICKRMKSLQDVPQVQLLGFVENEADFYAMGDIVINPTYLGTGLKIKTFESLAYGKITMAHPHSVQGIFKPDKAPVFTSTIACEWVDFLIRIWSDSREILSISRKSLEYITEMNYFVEQEYNRFLGE